MYTMCATDIHVSFWPAIIVRVWYVSCTWGSVHVFIAITLEIIMKCVILISKYHLIQFFVMC